MPQEQSGGEPSWGSPVSSQFHVDPQRLMLAQQRHNSVSEGKNPMSDLRRILTNHGLMPKRRSSSGHAVDTSTGSMTPLSSLPGSPASEMVDFTFTASHPSNSPTQNSDYHHDLHKYGRFDKIVGSGTGGIVRLLRRKTDGKVYAVKRFGPLLQGESERAYVKKITAEFCVSTTLRNTNIIETVDMVQYKSKFYQVMEYAPYDLYASLMTGGMSKNEIYCIWRQIVAGVDYLHSLGLAHRDLKIDNCVLTSEGIVKVIDFGTATVFKHANNPNVILARGAVGSDPYIAPEVLHSRSYDPALADVWSLGVILACMLLRNFPWKIPEMSDMAYQRFVNLNPELVSPLNIAYKDEMTLGGRLLPSRVVTGVDQRGWFDNKARDPNGNGAHSHTEAPDDQHNLSAGGPSFTSMFAQSPTKDSFDAGSAPSDAGTSGVSVGSNMTGASASNQSQSAVSSSPESGESSSQPSGIFGALARLAIGTPAPVPHDMSEYEAVDGDSRVSRTASKSESLSKDGSRKDESPPKVPEQESVSQKSASGNGDAREPSKSENGSRGASTNGTPPGASLRKHKDLYGDINSELSLFTQVPPETRSCLMRMLTVDAQKRSSLGDILRGGDGTETSDARTDLWLPHVRTCCDGPIPQTSPAYHRHVLVNPLEKKKRQFSV